MIYRNNLKSFLSGILIATCLLNMAILPLSSHTPCGEEVSVTTEQRKHPRYIIPEIEFQIFTRDARFLGKLVDISKGGLAFRFSSGSGEAPEYRTIDITANGPERFNLAAISCRRVYEISVLTEDQSFSGTRTRRCGVQFIDLNDVKEQQLDFLLDHYGYRLNFIL